MLRICSWFVLALGLAGAALADSIDGTLRVVDGDTVDVAGVRVRLHGIDAPERDQPCTTLSGQNWACGDWVTRRVHDLFDGRAARCTPLDVDRYGRTVARCTVGQRDMGQVLVQEGLAYAYRKYSMAYDLDEKAAVIADRGIHGFIMDSPARYRLTRIEGRSAPDPDCRIKGNINADGVRIYHLPGQAFYERTGIRPEKGERWFCSEAQARASGWRPARR
ncbi:nuclease [Sulfitobacter alexandrii]|uniref:Nuclease n=1 Tax=Sulfitobacter alexandrii TaxID=1917485 RepID=A0A1J0WEX8_9RHOB|nr:thermonuclease family protein [Sulfitobacter alexandrii]APE42869.1 nuclease [Sulfitobacter alexandrii]